MAAVVACAWVAGCTIETDVAPAPNAASEVMTSKRFNSPVSIDYSFTPAELDIKVSAKEAKGSACFFPLTFSHAVRATLDTVNEQAFRHIVPPGTAGAYRLRFDFVSFDPAIEFQDRALGGIAIARAEIALRASVTDPNGHEIIQQTIGGYGQDREEVSWCGGGTNAISVALQKTARTLAKEYAESVINALRID